jgi:hypothetical protein
VVSSVREKIIEQIRSAKRIAKDAQEAVKNAQEAVEKGFDAAVEKVRARTEEGHFVKDDPSTPENEAWVEKPKPKPKKKPAAKKKTTAKKKAAKKV